MQSRKTAKEKNENSNAIGRVAGGPSPPPFRYRHLGDLATIGRQAAVVKLSQLKLTSSPAADGRYEYDGRRRQLPCGRRNLPRDCDFTP